MGTMSNRSVVRRGVWEVEELSGKDDERCFARLSLGYEALIEFDCALFNRRQPVPSSLFFLLKSYAKFGLVAAGPSPHRGAISRFG